MEKEWDHLMEQEYILLEHGNLSLADLSLMTGEERQWWINRIQKQREKEREVSKSKGQVPGKIPESPGRPPT